MSRRPPIRLLGLKVWRDTLSLGSTSIALIVLILLGVSLFVMFAQAGQNLELSYRTFYAQAHFADVTILVESAPESLVETARLIPGVYQATGRAVKDGTIILRDRPRKRVQGRFIGTQVGSRPPINDLQVVRGRYLASRNDCLIEQQFAHEHQLDLGDLITASYLGRRREFRIVGIVASPEYLYPAPSKEQSFASPQWFGVCWIDDDAARQWLGLGRTITELHVLCRPGTANQVLPILEDIGRPYGLRTSWTQVDQPSNHLLSLDLTGFMMLSVMLPALFLFAAGLSLYSSLTRIGRLQTGIVGFLRASGFTAAQVRRHYVAQGALLSAAGALPGAVIGHFLAGWITVKYGGVLHVPVILTPPHPAIVVTGVVMAVATGLLAAWVPARATAATPPAVAMRGDRAEEGTAHGWPWLMALTARVPIAMRIALRGLLRRPSRSLFAIGGLASGTALLLSQVGMYTSIMDTIDSFMYQTLRYELELGFVSSAGEKLADAVAQVPGVTAVSKRCGVVVRIHSATAESTMEASGYETDQSVMAVRAIDGRLPRLQPGDLWLPLKAARKLHVEPGDPILVEWAYSSRSRNVHTVMRVGGLLDPSLGAMALGEYQDLKRRLVDRVYPEGSYGAMVACSPRLGAALRRQLERDDLVSAAMSINDARDEVRKSLAITILFITIMVSFGAVLSWAVLHSVSSVGILERLRELATLRSLGFSARQTTYVAAVEMYLMAGLALLFGLPVGNWLNRWYLSAYETETMTFRTTIPLWAYLAVTALVLAMVALSMQSGLARLRTMDLAQATKSRE